MRSLDNPATTLPRHLSVLVALYLVASVGCSRSPGEAPAAKTTTTADISDVHLLDLDGKPFELKKSSTGRVHVVVFIRSDCPVSNRMAPEVRALWSTYHPRGVDFYLIYVDPRETTDAIRAHLRDYEYPCPALRDTEHSLVAATGVTVTPEAVVFDDKWSTIYRGRINDEFEELGKSRSAPTKHDLHDAIEATLSGEPVAEPVTKPVGCYISDLK